MIFKHIHNVSGNELYAAYKLFFNTFSSEPRLRILNLLRKKSRNVGEIIKRLNMEQSRISHDLRRLKSCGFVNTEIKGKYRNYTINNKTIKPLMNIIDKHMEKNCLMIIKRMKGEK